MKKNNLFSFLVIIIASTSLFWQFFVKTFIPFPGDYLLAWYQPWKQDHLVGNTITIAHKAVADDVFRQLIIYKSLFAYIIKLGQLPLWNPFNGAGMPFLAVMHAGFLTPFNLLFLALPLWLAWSLYIFLQEILLGSFMYLYLKKIKLKTASAIFGSIVLMLSGVVIVRLLYGEYLYVFSCLPLLLFILEDYLQNRQSKKIFFIPLIILFMFISGQPQIILYVLIFTIVYMLLKFRNIKQYISLLILFFLGIGMASIQLIPTLELFLHASINTNSSQFIFKQYLLPIQNLVTILIPNYFGNQATYNYWGYGDYIETAAYVGLIPVFLAIFSLYKKKNPLITFNWVIVIVTSLSTLNWFLPKLFFQIPIPILSTGVPSRVFLLTTFSLSVLAAFGLHTWIQEKFTFKQTIKFIFPYFLGIFVLGLVTFILYVKHISCGANVTIVACRQVSFRNTSLEIFIFTLFIAFFLFSLIKQNIKKYFIFLSIFLTFAIGFYNAEKFLPFSPKTTLLPTTSLLSFIQTKANLDRVFGFGDANIKTDFASYFHFYDPQYYDPLYNSRYGQLVAYANLGLLPNTLKRSDVEIINDEKTNPNTLQRRQRLLNLLGTKYFIYSNTNNNQSNTIWHDRFWHINNNPSSLPRSYIVNNFVVENSNTNLLKKLFDSNFDINNSVVLEKSIAGVVPQANFLGNAKISTYSPNKIVINTTASAKSLLVLTDNYYPGWYAIIDGKNANVLRANYSFRAVVIPQGNHIVTFIYKPLSFIFGAIISATAFILFLIVFILRQKLFKYF